MDYCYYIIQMWTYLVSGATESYLGNAILLVEITKIAGTIQNQ